MGTTRKPEGLGDTRSLLQGSDAPVRYDVSRGLARHQQLVARAAPLPEWAHDLAPETEKSLASKRRGHAFAKRAGWLGGTLVVVAVLWLGVRGAGRTGPTELVPAALSGRPRQAAPLVPTPTSGADHAAAARTNTAASDQLRTPRAESSLPGKEQPGATQASAGAPVETRPLSTDIAPIVTPTPEQTSAAVRATSTSRTATAEASTSSADIDNAVPQAARVTEARAANGVPSTSARPKAHVRAESPRDAEEMRQLVEAERLLKSEPVRALRIVREGHVTFKAGYFAQERRYIEVMALFALGRRGEAHAQATWFLRDYLAGPYRHRVESEMLRLPVR